MEQRTLPVLAVVLGVCLGLSSQVWAGSVLIDDYGPSTTVYTISPWSVVSEQLLWTGYADGGRPALTTSLGSLASQVDKKNQFEFTLTVSSDYEGGGALYFRPYDGSYHELRSITLTAGTSTTVVMPYSLWPSFDPSNFAGYAFTCTGTTGALGSVVIDNLQATPELSTILLYALGLVLCGIYVRMRH